MEYQRTHDFVYGADGEILNEAPKDFYLPQD